jgi:hypothetical protein
MGRSKKAKRKRAFIYSKRCNLVKKGIEQNKLIAKPKPIGKGMEKYERQKKAGLLYKSSKHKVKYLRQDMGTKGVSSKVIALMVTRANPKEMPFEHLSLARIKSIIYR